MKKTAYKGKFYQAYKLHHLFLFYYMVECGGMKKAAEKLGVSISTISQQIKHLNRTEGELCSYSRSYQKMVLTELGTSYYERTKDSFDGLLAFIEG